MREANLNNLSTSITYKGSKAYTKTFNLAANSENALDQNGDG